MCVRVCNLRCNNFISISRNNRAYMANTNYRILQIRGNTKTRQL